MSARQEAIEAIAGWCGGDIALAGRCVDSISPKVLAELAIERGALVPCGWRWRDMTFGSQVVHHWRPAPDVETEKVYRITDGGVS